MAIELATRFDSNVDEMFKAESKKALLTNNNYDFNGAHTVKVYKIGTSDMNDYDRQGTGSNWSRYGEVKDLDATTEEMTLKKDRSFTFTIDKLDENETNAALQGATALARQIREKVIPEVDTYIYSQMTTGAGTKPAALTLTKDNIYDEIIKANAVLDDNEIPEDGRSLVVSPAVYLLLKKSPDITLDTEVGQDMRIRGVIGNLDGTMVIKIPSSRLPKNFGFMLVHNSATVAPTKLEEYKIHTDVPGISGSLVEGRIVYDAFVLDNKAKGIYYQANKVAE